MPQSFQARDEGYGPSWRGAPDLVALGDANRIRVNLTEALADWWPGALPAMADAAVVLSTDQVAAMAECCGALHRALRAVVQHYPHDARIRAIYDLNPAMRDILSVADGMPYQVGCYRPDFVFDAQGHPRICEIGARYPLNGWVISALLEAAVSTADCEPAAPVVPTSFWARAFWSQWVACNPPGSTIALVHHQERGSEVHRALRVLAEYGVSVRDVAPQALQIRHGTIMSAQGSTWHPIDHCLLELDRSELTLVEPAVLQAMIAGGQYRNDVRTLILVHDKRVLTVLSDRDILTDLVGPEDVATLTPWLIPSHVGNDPTARAQLLAAPQDLIAKRSSGGRGIDALIRSQCATHEWRQLVEAEWSSFMFQDYLDQLDFESGGAAMHLVGMMLCWNERFLGPGVFRGSQDAIINVHQGRGQLYPVQVRP
ncbi:hypothetical protein [Ahniella affigens]|uniref:hypothetical protein n=1 Tax=Ahniella affigens TaxID=2021234 RepID=UPI00147330D9|nr:hypothetical protein [Ahniella affigens]